LLTRRKYGCMEKSIHDLSGNWDKKEPVP
jgi:hypothetical protein